jgi:hypothetical protein
MERSIGATQRAARPAPEVTITASLPCSPEEISALSPDRAIVLARELGPIEVDSMSTSPQGLPSPPQNA